MVTGLTPPADRRAPRSSTSPADGGIPVNSAPPKLEELERREGGLWRSALFLMTLLAAAVALLSWDTIRSHSPHLGSLPVGLVVLVVLFSAYAWSKTRELAELRGLVRGIEKGAAAPPSEEQIQKLFALVMRSQQGYRDLIDSFDDLLLALNLDGEILAANRQFAALLDLPFHDIIGHRLDEFLDDPDGVRRAEAQKALPRFLERRHWSGTIPVRLKRSPHARYFDCVLHALVKEGRVASLSVLARDVTQQRESEARFTELFETLQEGVYFTTPEGKLLGVNPALVRMLGYRNKEELLAVPMDQLCLDTAQLAAAREDLEKQGHLQAREITLRRKDGAPVICLNSAAAIRDTSGRVLRHQGTLVDITQRREIEKRLQREQEFARSLVNSFPDLIVVLDSQGRYTYVSPRIKEVLGYLPEELVGRSLGERTDPEHRIALLDLFEKLTTGKQVSGNLEYRTRHKLGGWRILRASACPLFDSEGQIAGIIAASRDVTEIKSLERQVIQSEKLAAMGQMIAGVAHELNNPLTAILGVTELLRERAADDTTRRQLDLAHRQARRAASIIQSLLAFSRPATPKTSKLNVSEIVQRTLQLHENSLRANRITVDFMPEPNLPRIAGDPNQLAQVFVNLLTNAEQAIRQVRDHGTLRVRLGAERNTVFVAFQDDGVGIQPDTLPKLFDPFFTTKRPGGGTGLGLTICSAIVKEHGGNLEAHSLPGGGAVFTVSLPVESSSLVAQPVSAAEQEVPSPSEADGVALAASAPMRGRSVLVIDDEESILELVRDGLTAHGLLVDCATNPDQALDRMAQRAYDVVLSDLNLAGPQGPSLPNRNTFERLHEQLRRGKTQVIFMTGHIFDAGAAESWGLGKASILQKPFRISELLALLGAVGQTDAVVEKGSTTPPLP